MGPDGVGVAAVGLSVSGIDDVHVVHLAVVVGVEVGVIDGVGCQVAGFLHQLAHFAIVVAVVAVVAVIGVAFRYLDGSHHSEVRVVLACGPLVVVVPNASRSAILGVVAAIEFLVPEAPGGSVSVGELFVVEIDQNHQGLYLARRGIVADFAVENIFLGYLARPVGRSLLGRRCGHGGALLHGLGQEQLRHAVVVDGLQVGFVGCRAHAGLACRDSAGQQQAVAQLGVLEVARGVVEHQGVAVLREGEV